MDELHIEGIRSTVTPDLAPGWRHGGREEAPTPGFRYQGGHGGRAQPRGEVQRPKDTGTEPGAAEDGGNSGGHSGHQGVTSLQI